MNQFGYSNDIAAEARRKVAEFCVTMPERDLCDLPDTDDARWRLALLAIDLLAAAPGAMGGIVLRARSGPVRDAWEAALVRAVPGCRRLQASADVDALDGGLDLTATLASGRPVMRAGLIAESTGGVLVVPMAERLAPAIAARLAAARDAGGPALVLFDEGDGSDETLAAALVERLSMLVDLGGVRLGMRGMLGGAACVLDHRGQGGFPRASPGRPAGEPAPEPRQELESIGTLTTLAAALGIDSVRAPIHALRVARAHSTLAGRAALESADLEAAAALVLGPRATRIPGDEPPPEESPTPPGEPPPPDSDGDEDRDPSPDDLNDRTEILLDAAKTALPPGLLEALAGGVVRRTPVRGSGAGAKLRSLSHGRPAGVRAGTPGRGARLALIDTIKAAAPWQRLRAAGDADANGRLSIRRDDLRIRRYVARAQTTTVFAVDASGSAAIARLAEAKGAIELLLAQAYVKRAEVALVAFRGETAELLLPPTRSLARARRSLAELAGGGGTPLAAGIDMARAVAELERGKGRTPLVVVLTDGRANVAAGTGLSPQDAALASARALAASGLKSIFIDCGKRPRPEAAAVAAAMAARYVALPRLDARSVVAAVEALQ